MSDPVQLLPLAPISRPSVTDQVFDMLHAQVLTLELPPGAKLSEIEVARQMGVSRQPVRDAFYRLSKLGFLSIRPQRATTVSQISPGAVMRARFIRTALEIETVRAACGCLTEPDLQALEALLQAQLAASDAGDHALFHRLDDSFHREICERADLGFAWEMISDNKAHMDRVRVLSLSFASRQAYDDHVAICAALRARDAEAATAAMRGHLSRIRDQITRIRAENRAFFTEEN
ncbi:GntR family transcriptional regulator [Paracoccaceae bacterium Fryx2]|nr:GntR family transcriptional regulator [Paracoccaceae bacterium Fryx2]